MKVFVVRDDKGTISAYALPAPELEGQVGIAPRRGRSVTEIDVPELDGIDDVGEGVRRHDERLQDHRVEDGRLVR